jgi:hypothetical protein
MWCEGEGRFPPCELVVSAYCDTTYVTLRTKPVDGLSHLEQLVIGDEKRSKLGYRIIAAHEGTWYANEEASATLREVDRLPEHIMARKKEWEALLAKL